MQDRNEDVEFADECDVDFVPDEISERVLAAIARVGKASQTIQDFTIDFIPDAPG